MELWSPYSGLSWHAKHRAVLLAVGNRSPAAGRRSEAGAHRSRSRFDGVRHTALHVVCDGVRTPPMTVSPLPWALFETLHYPRHVDDERRSQRPCLEAEQI